MSPRLTYASRSGRDSLFWLGIALVFGGVPLVIYYTTPEGTWVNLLLAPLLGLPPFVVSLVYVGRTDVLVLLPDRAKMRFIRSLFQVRQAREYAFSDAVRVEATTTAIGSSTSAWHEVHVCLKNGQWLALRMPDSTRAKLRAFEIAKVLGVPHRTD